MNYSKTGSCDFFEVLNTIKTAFFVYVFDLFLYFHERADEAFDTWINSSL